MFTIIIITINTHIYVYIIYLYNIIHHIEEDTPCTYEEKKNRKTSPLDEYYNAAEGRFTSIKRYSYRYNIIFL